MNTQYQNEILDSLQRATRPLADERVELIAALKDCRDSLRDLWALQFKGTPPQNDTLDHATEILNRFNS